MWLVWTPSIRKTLWRAEQITEFLSGNYVRAKKILPIKNIAHFHPMENKEYFEANKDAWNKRTAVHIDSSFYNNASFKAGKSTLNKTELEELGNVQGKNLLHLQCHFGQDTLSWARLGAKVTGVDISDKAIEEAKKLSSELNIPAQFICCNVYDLFSEERKNLEEAFDIVFTSYGTIGWLPNLDKWANIISKTLKPGGIFYMVDFHPVLWMWDDDFTHIKYAYQKESVISEEQSGTYADRDSPIQYKEYSWNHSISEILNALINNDLSIQQFNEFNFSHYNCFNNTVQGDNGCWYIKGMEKKLPMMYSLRAAKSTK